MAVLYDKVQVVRTEYYVHATLRLSGGNWYQLRVYTTGLREWRRSQLQQRVGKLQIMAQMFPCGDVLVPEAIRDRLTAEMMAARLNNEI